MKKLSTPIGVFGPYTNVETLSDRYRCDDFDFPLAVVGEGVIEDAQPGDFQTPTRPPKSREELQAEVVQATQQRLDDFARTRNYDGILSLCSYATDPDPKFAAEGQRGVVLRSQTWAKLYAILTEVEAGIRPMPTGFADIEPELPELTW